MGLGGEPEVSLHCDDVLLIEAVVGPARERVQIASWFASACHQGRWPRGVCGCLAARNVRS